MNLNQNANGITVSESMNRGDIISINANEFSNNMNYDTND